jgi:hypothetical protein
MVSIFRELFLLSTIRCRRIPTVPACRCPWTKSMHNVVRALNIQTNSTISWVLLRSMNSCLPVKSGTMCKSPRPRPARHPRHLPVDDNENNNSENDNSWMLLGILGMDGAGVPVPVHRRICPRILPRTFCHVTAAAVEGTMIPKMIQRLPPSATRSLRRCHRPTRKQRLPPSTTRSLRV